MTAPQEFSAELVRERDRAHVWHPLFQHRQLDDRDLALELIVVPAVEPVREPTGRQIDENDHDDEGQAGKEDGHIQRDEDCEGPADRDDIRNDCGKRVLEELD